MYAKDEDAEIGTLRTYHKNDEEETEVEKEDIVEGQWVLMTEQTDRQTKQITDTQTDLEYLHHIQCQNSVDCGKWYM